MYMAQKNFVNHTSNAEIFSGDMEKNKIFDKVYILALKRRLASRICRLYS